MLIAKKWVRRLDRLLIFLLVLGFLVHSWGWAFNEMAKFANDGRMPTIGEVPDEDHAPVDENTKFWIVWLADKFEVHHPLLDEQKLSAPIAFVYRQYEKYLVLPKDGLRLASIGDMMRWSGAALFLFMIPPVLVRIPFRLWRDGIRFRWKKRSK